MPTQFGAPTLEEALSASNRWGGFNQNMNQSAQQIGQYIMQQNLMKQTLANEIKLAQEKANAEVDAQMRNPMNRILMGGKVAEAFGNAGMNAPAGLADFMGGQGGNFGQISGDNMPTGNGSPVFSAGVGQVNQGMPTLKGQGGLVATEFKRTPFGSFIPQKLENLGAQAELEGMKTSTREMTKAKTDAQIGISRDVAQMSQTAQALKNMLEIHNDLTSKGLAGSTVQGMYSENVGYIPTFGGLQSMAIKPEDQERVGQFVSARNESLVKMQPQLSQQFGQAGSVRIMDSLLQLAGQELPSLKTPNAMAHGQVKGTLRTMYIIKKAGDQYAELLQQSGQPMPQDAQQYIAGVAPIMNQIKTSLTPEEEQELQTITNDVIGKEKNSIKSVNPIYNNKSTVSKKLDENTARQILKQAGNDREKARLIAKQQGFSF